MPIHPLKIDLATCNVMTNLLLARLTFRVINVRWSNLFVFSKLKLVNSLNPQRTYKRTAVVITLGTLFYRESKRNDKSFLPHINVVMVKWKRC